MQDKSTRIRRKGILLLLGVTKAVASTEKSIPGRWHEVFDTIRVGSQTAHLKLIEIDQETASEFYDMEELFKRKIGKGKLYTEKDLENARKRMEAVEFKS